MDAGESAEVNRGGDGTLALVLSSTGEKRQNCTPVHGSALGQTSPPHPTPKASETGIATARTRGALTVASPPPCHRAHPPRSRAWAGRASTGLQGMTLADILPVFTLLAVGFVD